MAKIATRSSKRAQSSSSASAASNQKVILRVNSEEKAKKSSKRPNSAKRGATKQKKKYAKFDAKKPKKPPTAFFYFLEDFRKEFQEQNPDVKSMRVIGKACGEKWKTMTYEILCLWDDSISAISRASSQESILEKVKYYDIATEKRAEFDRAMADYIKRKESGEDQESEDGEDDSEFDEYA